MPKYSIGNLSATAVTLIGTQTITGQKIFNTPAATVDLIVRAASSKTANMTEWRDATESIILRVTNTGQIVSTTGITGVGIYDGSGVRVFSDNNRVPVSGLTASGTRDATTFLRGDNTWAVPAGTGGGSGGSATDTEIMAIMGGL